MGWYAEGPISNPNDVRAAIERAKRVVLEEGLNQDGLKTCALTDLRMAFQIRAGSNPTLNLFHRQHRAAAYQQRHVVDLFDQVRGNVFPVQ